MKVIRVVAGIFFNSRGEILLGRRFNSKNPQSDGFWEFPGGKLEEGESLEAALVREIREEIAAEVVPESLKFFHRVTWDYGDKPLELYFLKGKLLNDDLSQMKRSAHSDLVWVSVSASLTYPSLAANREVLDLLQTSVN